MFNESSKTPRRDALVDADRRPSYSLKSTTSSPAGAAPGGAPRGRRPCVRAADVQPDYTARADILAALTDIENG
jgi:hypothetical protein